jgi:hypothetical protein
MKRYPGRADVLKLYGRVLSEGRVAIRSTDPIIDPISFKLRITGLARLETDGDGIWLCPRNRVFAAVFDGAWTERKRVHHPYADQAHEWQRQRKPRRLRLRGEALAAAKRWMAGTEDVSAAERDFIETSRLAERRFNLSLGMAAILLLVIFATALAWQHIQNAAELGAANEEIKHLKDHNALVGERDRAMEERARAEAKHVQEKNEWAGIEARLSVEVQVSRDNVSACKSTLALFRENLRKVDVDNNLCYGVPNSSDGPDSKKGKACDAIRALAK